MKEKYSIFMICSSGWFFGSVFGRTDFGNWVTTIAALAMVIGAIGYGSAIKRNRKK